MFRNMSERVPNILIIMSDQHNPHLMGCAGSDIVRTPNLDALASSGVQFTNAYCASPLCVPSRMSFMTGKYPSKIDVYSNAGILSSAEPTFAHALESSSYKSVLCGRMHFVGPDQLHGFGKRIFGDVEESFLTRDTLGSGPAKTNGQSEFAVQYSGYGKTGYEAYDKEVTVRACEFIQSHDANDGPYCMVVGYVLPHNPLICSKEWFDYYYPLVPERQEEEASLHPAIKAWKERRGCYDITPEQARRALAAYYGLISEMDDNVGRVMRSLEETDGVDNTVVIYCSDHGDMASEHGMWWKCSFYEGSVRVPLIVSYPGVCPAGETRNEIVSLIDLAPTIVEIAGASPLSSIDARSLVPLLGNRQVDWPSEVFSECYYSQFDQPSCMVRTGPWKLNYYEEFRSCQLFNLEEDPGEMIDLSSNPAYSDTVAKCMTRINGWWSAGKMVEGSERDANAWKLIECGEHELDPQGISDVESNNKFDCSQLV